ncbi:MAG: hypothetical protein NZL95_09455 [Chitinophagales bacterium]|nr:hypothetical protein [Chitinophagales bacterium]MDW8428760.1 hypothetical protein [Chitinophagales bacterium]
MKNRSLWLVFLSFCFLTTRAQLVDLPDTDIYILNISTDEKGNLVFDSPRKITQNKGYDNQPSWYPDGSAILYSTVPFELDTPRADINKYILSNGRTLTIINTPRTSEFSPMLMADKTHVSVVRILEDDSTQVLAKCADGTDDCQILFPKLKGVGYYTWLDQNRVAMALLGEELTLVIGHVATGRLDTLAVNVGRCLQRVPGRNPLLAFVDKNKKPWTIRLYDGRSGKISDLVPVTGAEDEDFAFMPDGSILMGSQSFLYRHVPAIVQTSARSSASAAVASKQEEKKQTQASKEKKQDQYKVSAHWAKVADFSQTAIRQFYRLAVSPNGDKIALVTYSGIKP